MRRHNRINFKAVLWGIIAILVPIMIYLMVDIGSAADVFKQYESIKPSSSSGYSKSLTFLKTYTQTTGDISLGKTIGMTDEQMQDITGDDHSPTSPDDVSGDSNIPGNIDKNDLRSVAKAICSSYLINGQAYYVSSSRDTNYDVAYGSVTVEGRTLSPYSNKGVYNRCCNGLSSGILFLCGINKYNDGSNISQGWPYISCEDIYRKVGTSVGVTTAGQLRVGDIICVTGSKGTTGHVETVVYIDGGKVYVASAGSDKGILSTAQQGYQRVFDSTQVLDNYYNQGTSSHWYGVRGVKRP